MGGGSAAEGLGGRKEGEERGVPGAVMGAVEVRCARCVDAD